MRAVNLSMHMQVLRFCHRSNITCGTSNIILISLSVITCPVFPDTAVIVVLVVMPAI